MIKLKYKPLKAMKPFHFSKKTYKCLLGKVRSGKTFAAIAECLKVAAWNRHKHFPTCRVYVVRQGYREMEDATIPSYIKTFRHLWGGRNPGHFDKTRLTYTIATKRPMTEVKFLFRSFQEIESLEKKGGLEITIFVIEEASEFDNDHLFDLLTMRLSFPTKIIDHNHNTHYPTYRGIVVSNAPQDQTHWIYKRFFSEVTDPKLFEGFNITDDNPYVGKKYYKRLTAGLNPQMKKRFLDGKSIPQLVPGTEVYHGFSYRKNTPEKPMLPDYKYPIIRGWDIGGGSLHLACVFLQIFFKEDGTKEVRVYDEVYNENSIVTNFADTVLAFTNVRYKCRSEMKIIDICDPIASTKTSELTGQTVAEALTVKEIYLIPAPSQGFEKRKIVVQSVLTTPNLLLVNKHCELLIDGFEGLYRYKKVKNVVIPIVVQNKYAHPHSALQYALSFGFLAKKEIESNFKQQYLDENDLRLI
jgi:hypothetical protein